jgi:hypothetical protein
MAVQVRTVGGCGCASVGWLIHDGPEVKALAPNLDDLGRRGHAGVEGDPHPDARGAPDRAACGAGLALLHFFLLLFGLSLACVNVEAAALFSSSDAFGSHIALTAFDAAFFDVCSFFAIGLDLARHTIRLNHYQLLIA